MINRIENLFLRPDPDALSWFAVELIPQTLAVTNLKFLRVGERVNIELDLIGKYLFNFRKQF